MARFLCAVWPFSGHLNPTIAAAHALRARGHEVGIYSGEAARATIEGEGFTFFPFDSLAARLQEIVDGVPVGRAGGDNDTFYWRLSERYSRSYQRKGAGRGRLLKAMYREWIVGTVPQQVADLKAIMDRWHPDALLCDSTVWGPILVLREAYALPVAVFSFFAGCLIPGPDAPPPGLGLPSARDWPTRIVARVVATSLNVLALDLRRAANAIRQPYGLPALREPLAAVAGRMPLYLVTTIPELDYERRDLPPSVHYVGACSWDRPRDEARPTWLDELPGDRPIVYVTEGTSQMRDAIVLQAAVRGLGHRPMHVILTTGRHRDPGGLGLIPSPPNIRVERFVAHSDLFPRLHAVVTNGGSGTVRAALAAGLPLVIVPMEWDQHENAQRVVEAGAGLRLSSRSCTPELLRQAVQRVLDEPGFRTNAERLQSILARHDGPGQTAELLEHLVSHPKREPVLTGAAAEKERA